MKLQYLSLQARFDGNKGGKARNISNKLVFW